MHKILGVMLVLAVTSPAAAQDWAGGYISGHIGLSRIPQGSNNTVRFDRDLDGDFDDTITTAAGADAFSPGFCVGVAATALPSAGCAQDNDGLDAGGRAGYDWQRSGVVFGVVGELQFVDHVDSVSAFSTTPANYVFTRELNWLGGVRARVGGGWNRLLAYGTGGVAWAGLDHSFRTTNAVNTFVESGEDRTWGYQAGGGLEFRLGGGWTAGAEYLWTALKDDDRYIVRAQGPAPATNPFILGNPGGSDLRRADDLEFGSIKFVMGYHF